MIDYENLVRAGAVVAAAALVAGPSVVGFAQAAFSRITNRPAPAKPTKDDAHTVVEIARRLQAAGNDKGVELCQQLLDVMLRPEAKKR